MLSSATASCHLVKPESSFHKSAIALEWQRKGQPITLNKIEDAIENDTQMRIQRIGTGMVRGRYGDDMMIL
jgi:hypothetical protein